MHPLPSPPCPVTCRRWTQLTEFWTLCLSYVDASTGLWLTGDVLADIRIGVHCGGRARCTSGIITPWIVQRLQWSVELATALGHTSTAALWNATAHAMATAFRTMVVAPAAGGVPAHVPDIAVAAPSGGTVTRVGFSQAGHTVAVFSGLLDAATARDAMEFAFPAPAGDPAPHNVTRWNNPTYLARALRALTHVNLTARAAAHVKDRFAQYLPGSAANPVPPALQGPVGGPLPEYWVSRIDNDTPAGQRNPTQPVDGTGSHGWCSVALVWMHECLLGVTLASPGGGRLNVAPDDSGLPYVAGDVATPHGVVQVTWNYTPNELRLQVPPGVSEVAVTQPPTCVGALAVTSLPAGATAAPGATAGVTVVSNPAGASVFTCTRRHHT